MRESNLLKLRGRLLCRIGRRYRVVTEPLEIAGLTFSFTRIVDPDRVLDEVAAEADLRDRLGGVRLPGDELHLPYWAEVWESGRGMGEFLVRGGLEGNVVTPTSPPTPVLRYPEEPDHSREESGSSEYLRTGVETDTKVGGPLANLKSQIPPVMAPAALCSRQVLDLGCGMGMAGMVAAALGAQVLFADLETPALLFARLNSLPWRRRIRTRRLNWQRDRLDQRFDLILGADILYERAQWSFLESFWRAHLADGGHVLLGEPGRQTGDLFFDWIASKGWNLTQTEIPVTTRPRPVRIFDLIASRQ
jgi:predicted nicotinamide N-methyase